MRSNTNPELNSNKKQLEKKQLEDEINNYNIAIAAVNDKLMHIKCQNVAQCLCCCCALLLCVCGAAAMGSAYNDMANGNLMVGSFEMVSGAITLNLANNEMQNVSTAIDKLSDSYDQLIDLKRNLKDTRTEKQKELYRIEKKETLRLLERKDQFAIPCPPLLDEAVTSQFVAMDNQIEEGNFSKHFITVLQNTRNILNAPTQEMRNNYAKTHLNLLNKQSIARTVAGGMLIFVGTAVVIGSVFLAAVCFTTGPLAIIGCAAGTLAGVGLIAKGVQLIKSEMAKDKTLLIGPSLFQVRKHATIKIKKDEPPSSSYQYPYLSRVH